MRPWWSRRDGRDIDMCSPSSPHPWNPTEIPSWSGASLSIPPIGCWSSASNCQVHTDGGSTCTLSGDDAGFGGQLVHSLACPAVPFTVHIDEITEADWNSLLDGFTDANIYQTWAYGAIHWG